MNPHLNLMILHLNLTILPLTSQMKFNKSALKFNKSALKFNESFLGERDILFKLIQIIGYTCLGYYWIIDRLEYI